MKWRLRVSSALFVILFAGATTMRGADPAAGRSAQGSAGMAVSVSRPASEVGAALLARGGNAVDAAVATAFALAVTWPEAGNLGGGGFMVIQPAPDRGDAVVIDYRETAPAAATKDMFARGKVSPYLMVGTPGTVRGLGLAHKRFGRLPWKDVVLPAVKLAEEGFAINGPLAASLNGVLRRAPDNAELQRVYGKDGGKGAWQAGDRLVQPDLARTLRRLAEEGADAFYQGPLADLLVAEMKAGGGLITRDDLAHYQARERAPIRGTFRGYEIIAPPPPSSGGVALLEMLHMLETFDLKKQGRWSPETLHVLIEAQRRAYRDRARWLGDADFTPLPQQLLDKEYAQKLARGIDLKKATPSAELAGDIPLAGEGQQTTHFSVLDGDGMAVSNTYTLENGFGGRIVVRGAGYLLNDEMGDFNPQPGVTDRTGRIGTPPNLVAPGKRMLSSMTPVIVRRNGKVVLVTGSPGGRTIINTVLCVVLNVLEFDMPLRDAVAAPRLHHQWFPDVVHLEPALSREHPETVEAIRKMGHQIARPTQQGDAHSIFVEPGTGKILGEADRRRDGWAAGVVKPVQGP
jgi:gamma-glutamyltranspeptidase/glutathione hydrolase